MQVHLSPDLEALVQEKLESGDFGDFRKAQIFFQIFVNKFRHAAQLIT